MEVKPVDGVTFCYKSVLKKEFMAGRIPLKRDITGRPLKRKPSTTLDHTFPKAKGGKSNLENYTLMDYFVNTKRGTKPIKPFIDIEALIEYLDVMINVKTIDLDGVEYVKGLLKNLLKDFKENK